MTKNGKKVIFEVTTCRILNENYTLVTSATVYNALYWIDSETHTKNNAFIAEKEHSLWHRRMGHIFDRNMGGVKKSSIGIKFEGKTNKPSVLGVKSNETRKSIRSVVGPLCLNSFSGARYLITFANDYYFYTGENLELRRKICKTVANRPPILG